MPDAEDLAARIAALEAELAEIRLPRFTTDDAHRLGEILVGRARERGLPIAVDVTRGTQVVFHVAMEGATADNDDWIRRKTAAVQRFGEASLLVGLRARLRGRPIEDEGWFDETRYAAHGGCVPVVVQGVGMVATATVSGLAQEDDHALVVDALRTLAAEMAAEG
ncbi:MAG: heme-degrading domain-containing protein [Actinomycetales bacterium]|jgi:uncharacterized protein (UPF0303 family)|nr:heme-degrading domain-containing protein [Actinomycetales bacterium]